MSFSNIHCHTTFSDGKHTPEENVLAAIRRGMPSIGISDHSYTPFDLSYCIKKEDLAAYKAEVRRLKERYQDQIDVLLGLELDGAAPLEDRGTYDYLLGDCHYLFADGAYHSIDHCIEGHIALAEQHFSGDYTKMSCAYYATYAEKMCALKPDILGHFDLVTKFGFVNEEDPQYLKAAKECLAACLSVTPVVEVNTGAIARGHRQVPYPSVPLLRFIRERGGRLILGSDSHDRANLDFWFPEAVALIKTQGFRCITVLRKDGFHEIEI